MSISASCGCIFVSRCGAVVPLVGLLARFRKNKCTSRCNAAARAVLLGMCWFVWSQLRCSAVS
eukprot:7445776-Alexandrium_andersonii.AAC.1